MACFGLLCEMTDALQPTGNWRPFRDHYEIITLQQQNSNKTKQQGDRKIFVSSLVQNKTLNLDQKG
jgi:hypothetical protein